MSLNLVLATLAGGLGLFLLGMSMMSEGLKLAAGPALERILQRSTRTRWHALGSGMLVTALVQSSSAVTVATIGFVNAGLLSLGPALWVLFGANVGTTMTGWIVALLGLKFKIEGLALPLIGLGVLLRLTGAGRRRGALGDALAGFGLLFLGIALLQQAFTGLSARLELPQGEGGLAVLAQVGAGALMTVLMQSSSASMAIALTAAQGGLLSTQGAAAVVIGANIGTTVTALLAAIGATANARRAAAAHVIFNGLTGLVALALLPWMISALGLAREALGLPPDPAAKLALFHTSFNLLGVLLMWPLAATLTRFLQARFRAREDDEAMPRHLDQTVLAVPALALDALAREVERVGQLARRMTASALTGADAAALAAEQRVLARLDAAVADFVEQMQRGAMSAASSARLALLLRQQRYHETAAEQASLAAGLSSAGALADEHLRLRAALFAQQGQVLLELCERLPGDDGSQALAATLQSSEDEYQLLKAALLSAGAAGSLRMVVMEEALRHYSALRRALQQSAKAALTRQSQPLSEPTGVLDP